MFIIPFLVVFLLPAVYTALFDRSYEANSLVWIDKDVSIVPIIKNDQSPNMGVPDRPIQEEADTLQQLLQSRSFATEVIDRTPLRSKMGTLKQRARTIRYIQKNLRTEVVGPNALKITFFGKSPEQAVVVATAATDEFLSWVRDAVKAQNNKSVGFFQQQADQYSTQVDQASAELRDFKVKNPSARQLDVLGDKVLTAPDTNISPEVQMEFQRLKSEEEYARELYDDSLTSLAKTRALAAGKEEQYLTGFRVVDKPITPASFSRKRLLLSDLLAFMAAIVVATVAVVVAEVTDRTLHGERDVKETLDLPVLVEIKQPPNVANNA